MPSTNVTILLSPPLGLHFWILGTSFQNHWFHDGLAYLPNLFFLPKTIKWSRLASHQCPNSHATIIFNHDDWIPTILHYLACPKVHHVATTYIIIKNNIECYIQNDYTICMNKITKHNYYFQTFYSMILLNIIIIFK